MRRLIVTMLLLLSAASPLAAQPEDELRKSAESIVSALQESWNARDAQRWSESFAEKHDYVAIGGMLLAELTPQQNATGHTALWNGRFSAVQQQPSGITMNLSCECLRGIELSL